MDATHSGRRRRIASQVLVATGVVLAVGLVLQLAVRQAIGDQHALTDVVHVFHLRGIRPDALPYFDRVVEYPVLIGYAMYAMSWAPGGSLGFFLAGAAISASLALVVTAMLERRGSPHVWRWAIGLPLFLYAFHNWDLLAIGPAVVGLVAFERNRDRVAGVAIGLGAAAKLFPGMFLLPLAAVRLAQGRRRDAFELLGAGAAVLMLVNLPVLLIAPQSWWWTAQFQGARPATWGTLWYYLFKWGSAGGLLTAPSPTTANIVSFVALGAGLIVVTRLAMRRGLGTFEIGAAMTGIFLLTNKVYSPVYDLWVVPFFAALPIRRRVWLTFCTAEAGVYFLVYGHTRIGFSIEILRVLLPVFVIARAGAIAAVVAAAVRGGRSTADHRGSRVERGRTRSLPDARTPAPIAAESDAALDSRPGGLAGCQPI